MLVLSSGSSPLLNGYNNIMIVLHVALSGFEARLFTNIVKQSGGEHLGIRSANFSSLHCNLERELHSLCLSFLPQADKYDHYAHSYCNKSQTSHYG